MMCPQAPYIALLKCHPKANSHVVHGIQARVLRTQPGVLRFTYTLEGDIGRLRIPPPRPPGRAELLWQHTCFEAFVCVKGDSAYHEFNFAPSGEWAAYAFRHYRDSEPLAIEDVAPAITVRRTGNRLEIDAIVRLNLPPGIQTPAPLRLGLCAVIEEMEGALSYWALKHPAGKPDFHHPDAFALEIEPLELEVASESFMNRR